MAEFIKGLSERFVTRLNEEYARGGWWREVLEDEDLYLGIRRESLNVYYKGCSLMRVKWCEGKLCAEVHYKYLLQPTATPTYVAFEGGRRKPLGDELFIDALNPRLLKLSAVWYAGDEKKGVHEILRSNPNIIDVEIGLVTDDPSDRPSAKRIDFAALQSSGEDVRLVFFEAKHFANLALRANGDASARVVNQIQRYEKLIDSHKPAIEASYRRVCANLCQLEGVRGNLKSFAALVTPSRTFTVDPWPRLVVFGFDDDQRLGAYWKKHRAKLEGGTEVAAGSLAPGLGKGRVLMRGNPKGFTKGISSIR